YGRYMAHIVEYQRYLDEEHSMAEEGAVLKSYAPEATKMRSPMTTGPSGNAEWPSLDAELADSETESDKTVTPVNKEKDASNIELTEINARFQDEG
nr:hypothetical protein [Tanacetum cinerariifolium]